MEGHIFHQADGATHTVPSGQTILQSELERTKEENNDDDANDVRQQQESELQSQMQFIWNSPLTW